MKTNIIYRSLEAILEDRIREFRVHAKLDADRLASGDDSKVAQNMARESSRELEAAEAALEFIRRREVQRELVRAMGAKSGAKDVGNLNVTTVTDDSDKDIITLVTYNEYTNQFTFDLLWSEKVWHSDDLPVQVLEELAEKMAEER